MSEASFKKHLAELETVLNQLLGDIESGPDGVVQDWYDQTLDVIYNYEDEVDSNLYVRLGMDEDSIEDGQVLEDEEAVDTEEQDTEEYQEEIVDSSIGLDESGEDEEAEEENDEDDADSTELCQYEDLENTKTITININLPNQY